MIYLKQEKKFTCHSITSIIKLLYYSSYELFDLILFFRFGNFLCNTIRDREHQNIMRTTTSIWAHLSAVQEEFRNILFKETDEVGIEQ